jgi:hypothetical protein
MLGAKSGVQSCGGVEVPIFAMPNIPTGQALVLVAVVILIMAFFPPRLSQIIFGALMLYILYRVVAND